MTSRLDVDGLQHTVHARCDRCGFALDLADRSGSGLGGLDWLGLGLTALALFCLMTLAASLEQFQKMVADFGTELPLLTRLTLAYQLPVPFLIASGLVGGVGAFRKARRLRGGTALLWVGCALGLVGVGVCAAGLYLPVFEMAGQISPE